MQAEKTSTPKGKNMVEHTINESAETREEERALKEILKKTGFTLTDTTDVSEIGARAYVMRHEKTAARLLFLKCDDANKAFSISFRTPPQDSTGVFHILEHSVLCGSKKYPVKEPFVNLLKTSMQTFLNAMTFPDKTMYPVASTNDQDLLNLTDVYLDAVFHPAIYEKETIFQQEGWHYERAGTAADASATADTGALEAADAEAAEETEDAATERAEASGENAVPASDAAASARDTAKAASQLAINGVVYNEMKGALSEPEEMLCDLINAGLFPDSPYGFESGGLPSDIPNLTYEQFLNEHRRHYRPDNSYIILYGDIDLLPMLTLIDQHLCTAQPESGAGSENGKSGSDNAGDTALQARTIAHQKPVMSLGGTLSMDISQENACCGIGYVLGEACDFTRINAMGVLIDALCGSNEAPLKRALLDEGVADDIDFILRDSMAQPYVLAYAKGIKPGALSTFHQLVTNHIAALVEGGIDPELIEAALSHEEFLLRERDFGYADGVINAMSALSGWLYDDDCPVEGLRYEKCFAYLREQLSQGYFEQLAREVFLQNNHVASGEILVAGTPNTAEADRLKKAAENMGAEGFAAVDATVKTLRAAQEQPDDPAAVAALPQLSPKDITDAKPWGAYGLDENAPVPCLRHHLETHGITYLQLYYDMDAIPFDQLPYTAVLAFVMGKLATQRWSAAQLDTLVQSKLGALTFAPKVVSSDNDPHAFTLSLGVGASCLETKTAEALDIIGEIATHTDFTDMARIKDILTQLRIQLEQMFIGAGHSVAMERVCSYLREGALVSQQVSGIDLYVFLKDLLAHFDERANELYTKLQAMATVIFDPRNVLASFTGTQTAYETFLRALSDTGCLGASASTGAGDKPERALAVPRPTIKKEAFIVPADVTYTACGHDRRLLDGALPYHGSQLIVANACSLDFIWNEVRVKGGAYGGGLRVPAKNDIMFYSYRDPRIDETLERYRATADWLRNFTPSTREFDGYVVSSVAALDNPQKPRPMIVAQNNAFLQGRAADFRLQCRSEVLESTPETVRSFADTLEAAANKESVCTIGNRAIIENAKTEFNTIELF